MGLFDGTPLENLVTCTTCGASAKECRCPPEGAGQPPWEPSKQRVQVRKEKRARGKMVTVVDGLSGTSEQLLHLLKALKDYCGAGGTCSETHVELQGDHTERLRKWLKEKGFRIQNST